MTAVPHPIALTLFVIGTLSGCSGNQTTSGGAVANAATPGWTGRTVVAGSTSTLGSNEAATEMQRKWQLGPNR